MDLAMINDDNDLLSVHIRLNCDSTINNNGTNNLDNLVDQMKQKHQIYASYEDLRLWTDGKLVFADNISSLFLLEV